MGMSASQVRFLSLQHRKHDVGRQLTALSNRKQALSRDMNKVAKNYTEALNQNVLKWSNDSGMTYQNLTYDLMMKPNDFNTERPYIVSTKDGKAVLDTRANLIGKVDDEYVELTDKIIQNGPMAGQALNYTNIAKWITTTPNLEGVTGNLYTTTDGLEAGTKNINAYVIPKNALEYGFENSLRYQIFEELGLVNANTTSEYYKLLEGLYGSEGAKKNGNYGNLLMAYIKADPSQGRILDKVADCDVSDLASVDAMGSVNLSEVNGIPLDPQNYSSYFGKVSEDGTWTGGCLLGNLAVAEHAITEYDNWCNDLKELSLDNVTELTFTSTSGRTNTQIVEPFLDMNNIANADGGKANDFDSNAEPWFQAGARCSDSDDLTTLTWSQINSSDHSIRLTDQKGLVVSAFLSGLGTSLNQGDSYSDLSGKTWRFTNDMANDMVENLNGDLVSVTEAARDFALLKTVSYYGTLESCEDKYGGCGSCYSTWVFYNYAAEVGGDDQNNVLGRSYSGRCFWHSITHFFGGLIGSIGTAIWGTFASIGTMIGSGFKNFSTYNALESTWDTFTDTWQGDGGYYTLDMQNVEKTFFTYYEMFMRGYEDGYNLLKGDAPFSSSSTYPIDDKISGQSALGSAMNSYTRGSIVRDYDPTKPDWRYSNSYNGATQYTNATPFSREITQADGTVTTVSGTTYDNEWGSFTALGGGTIHAKGDSAEDRHDGYTEVFFNTPQTTEDGTTYTKLKQLGDGTIEYYNGNTKVNPKRNVVVQTDSYDGLTVKERGTHFTNTVHTYITQDQVFKSKLISDVETCKKAIEDYQNKMKNFFSGREQKLMDYYDAIFLRVSESGWVSDPSISGISESNVYVNNKLQNNDYFVTVCQAKAHGGGYNYTNKQAVNVMKIFQVRDEDAENVALATYEAEKSAISVKERAVDARMQKLETEQEVINTELESIKKVRNDNIDKYFKIFA